MAPGKCAIVSLVSNTAHLTTTEGDIMSATITTTARLVTVAVEPGVVLNLPRWATGLGIDTAVAVERALEFTTPAGLLDELKAHYRDADAVGLPVEDAVRGFIVWMHDAGEWLE